MRLTAQDFPPGTPLNRFFPGMRRRGGPIAVTSSRAIPIACRPRPPGGGSPSASPPRSAIPTTRRMPRFSRRSRRWTRRRPRRPRRILVIRLSAFGDFIQSLGPFAAIRRHHAGDRISLLTTRPFAAFAEELGLFDEVLVDERPGPLALCGWLGLRRRLRQGRFDRVYDLQTSARSAVYAWLFRPGMPEWSGIAAGSSHPHANLERDHQHTIDRQAEQLLMAGIYPTPLPSLPPFNCALPEPLASRDFVLLVPGSSPQHPAKRWPAPHFASLARALDAAGYLPVVVGSRQERPLAAAIHEACAGAVDLVGETDIALLAVLCQHARLTVGDGYRGLPSRGGGGLPGCRAVFAGIGPGAVRPARSSRPHPRRARPRRSHARDRYRRGDRRPRRRGFIAKGSPSLTGAISACGPTAQTSCPRSPRPRGCCRSAARGRQNRARSRGTPSVRV